ncbi:thialysine N-epsilon-acetyltransferase-like [Argopecten irradians]|uniref:thialysine N-epsilon-acetyltransferase-like n=1 Tax=Argopecten irradians TaxID=31199 RepID=UPI003719C11E
MADIHIRNAQEEDVDRIFLMTKELAEHLGEKNSILVTPELLKENQMSYKCIVAEGKVTDGSSSKPLLGFALYVYRFDGWEGKVAILDSMYVVPEHRNKGIGSALYTTVAKDVVASGCSYMEQLVHNWNTSAQEFYKSKGAYDYSETFNVHAFRTPTSKLEEVSNPDIKL